MVPLSLEVWLNFLHLCLGTLLDAIQLMPPIALKRARPLVQRPDGLRIGSIELLPPIAPHVDQTHASQNPEVL